MQTSHLAVTKPTKHDPNENLQELYKVASTLNDGANAPAVKWLIHVSPTVIRNTDWPGLPQSSGDGLLMFGTSLYQASNVYLAWAPLIPGQHPPHPSTWRYYKADHPSRWVVGPAIPVGQEPTRLLKDVPPDPDKGPVAELSVCWQPRLQRWIMAHVQPPPPPLQTDTQQIVIRTSRQPWGTWSEPVVIFDRLNQSLGADAGNNQPGGKFVGLPNALVQLGASFLPVYAAKG